MNVPDEAEYSRQKKRQKWHFFFGIILGFLLLGLPTLKAFSFELGGITPVTWLCVVAGILAFGSLAYKFGSSFWATLTNF